MNLQQLRYLVAVRDNGLSITAAARTLNTSQPAVSRQIQLLERELGFQLFERSGRSLARTTAVGEQVISRADSVIREVQNIRRASAELGEVREGTLAIATTHTQARYVLPEIVRRFRLKYPGVRIQIHQGSSEQIGEMIAKGQVDFAMATGSPHLFPHVIRLPLYRWQLGVVVPRSHALLRKRRLALADIAKYPIVTYEFSLNSSASILAPFELAGVVPEVALTAQDADVVKAYVRVGLGVGLIAPFAVDPAQDPDLAVLDAPGLFSIHTSWIGFREGAFLNTFMEQFLQLLAPHISLERIRAAQGGNTSWEDTHVPLRGVADAAPLRQAGTGASKRS